jgi:nucleoside-diphosphate-sugar epimerase
MQRRRLLIFGYGYTAGFIAAAAREAGFAVAGTSRSAAVREAMAPLGVEPVAFGEAGPAIAAATHVLMTAAPGPEGDPALAAYRAELLAAPDLRWLGYLSTTGVYGDAGGAEVDEDTPLRAASDRGLRRVAAEAAWAALGAEKAIPATFFRLPGIYGPGRSALDAIRQGTARRIVKPGQIFSRVHAEDIASGTFAAMIGEEAGAFNLCDDEPAPPQDVTAEAARLLKVNPPPLEDFETASSSMSEMARSFYAESKRVSNAKAKRTLGWRPRYPTYREGLAALIAAGF